MSRKPAISDEVWRKGWRREAAQTQGASAEIAAMTSWCEKNGFRDTAKVIRDLAMQYGALKAQAALRRALQIVRGRR